MSGLVIFLRALIQQTVLQYKFDPAHPYHLGNHLLDGKYPTFSAASISVFRITAMAMKTRIQTSDEVVDVGGGLLLLAGFLYWFGLIGGPVHHPAGPA